MNVIEPSDAPAGSDAVTPAPVRTWAVSGLRTWGLLGGWAVFLVVGAASTVFQVRAGGGMSVLLMAVWWAVVAGFGVRELRRATRITLHADGSLELRGPARVVHTHVTRVHELREEHRWNERGQWRRPDIVLGTADGTVRLPRAIVTEDLVATLRAANPALSVPYFRGW